ncbi:hypothetical protein [Novosphingobium sp.]|uniref:hypothetical protein n=1 Tax=Novosphingobium sp. TaxID=1874826 RepID=UPI002632B260|nr:hypothetical protein [Novosphingobium sp.]
MNAATHTNLSGSVTLKLFQGLSGRKRGAFRQANQPAARCVKARSVLIPKWTLKQGQGDEFAKGAVRG